MSNILIRHVDVVTLDDAGTILFGADVAIEGKVIRAIGAAPPDFRADAVGPRTCRLTASGWPNRR